MYILSSANVPVLQPSTQQAIRNAMADLGVDEVYVSVSPFDGNRDQIFDVYQSDEETFLFSIDTDGDVIHN